MGSLTHTSGAHKRFTQTQGCEKFKREFLYIRWVNNKIRLFLEDIIKVFFGEKQYEDVFWGDKAKELTSIFKNFLKVKVQSNFNNFNNINFRLSSVDRIIKLKSELYYLMCEKLYTDFVIGDDEFPDFFEEFIIFTHRIFLKKEENYEDDISDIKEYSDSYIDIFSDSESDIDNGNVNDNGNGNGIDNDSDSDSDNDSDGDNNMMDFSSDSD